MIDSDKVRILALFAFSQMRKCASFLTSFLGFGRAFWIEK
jgi:hypothetical protein